MTAVGGQGFLSVVCPQAPWDQGENGVLWGVDSVPCCGAGHIPNLGVKGPGLPLFFQGWEVQGHAEELLRSL